MLAASCDDDKKAAQILRESTEIAKERTDSFIQVQKDSIAKERIREKRRSDSLRRVDSLRRIYERSNITISGKVGESSATLTVRRNNDIDGVSSLKVSISLTRVEDQYSGQVTFNRDGNSYTRQAILHKY